MLYKNSIGLSKKSISKLTIRRCAATASKPKISANHVGEEYQYLQKSKLPMLHFQKGLFRLPIPKLDETCQRYLNALKPLLSKSQLEETRKRVDNFQNGEGKNLDEMLKMKDSTNKHTSYISKPWFDMYLKDRNPLPLNYNPAIVFNRSVHSDSESQLCKAANMTISSLRFMKALKNNVLKPEVFHMNAKKTDTEFFQSLMRLFPARLALYLAYMIKAYPLDMSQYSSLFGTTRIPQEGKDILVTDETGKHIIVLRNGHMFKLKVLSDEGDILPPEDIFTCYKHILEQDLKTNENSIGILTTENRNVWARAREHLVKTNEDNLKFLKDVDSALFVVCLDDEILGENPDRIMRAFLHGDGSNRWFDKSFSLIISKDGIAAINFEHSWGDGVAVLRYIKDVFSDINQNPFTNSDTQVSNIAPECLLKKLDFALDEQSLSDIGEAKRKFDKTCRSLGLSIVQQPGLGRKTCTLAGISSDALMQLSFQVAYHRVYGDFVSTYESCSTSGFKHGRTEAIRPCTEATKNFALKFNDGNRPGKAELTMLLKECSEVHKALTKEAIMGLGFDRHLFALKWLSEEEGRSLPDLYQDEAYKMINYNILSTSTLAADAIMAGGFGPVVPDGLGIGQYAVRSGDCGVIVSSYRPERDGADFADALKATLNEFDAIFFK